MSAQKDFSAKQILRELYSKNLELHRERERMHQILTQVAEVIFAVDDSYKITVFNSSAENVFKVKGSVVVGKPADKYIKLYFGNKDKLLKTKDYCFKDSLSKTFSNEEAQELGGKFRVKVLNSKGLLPLYFKLNYANIVFGPKDKECVISLSNITEEVELDKQKDEFISIASHELKTPISIVKTNLWMFKHLSKEVLEEKQTLFMREVDTGLERLSKIVNNLLDISRIEQGRFVLEEELADVDALIVSTIKSMEEVAIKKGLKVVYPNKKVGSMYVDKERFVEILENLLSNAVKYTEKGGIRINVFDEGKQIKVSVTDTGAGISEEEQKKLFKKFSRAQEGLKQHSLGASTGLGLYISKRILKEMKGDIGVMSKLGKGSTFWFSIPKSKIKRKGKTKKIKSSIITKSILA